MASKKVKNQMFDYLVDKIKASGANVRPVGRRKMSFSNPTYMIVDGKDLVLSVDEFYSNDGLRTFYAAARSDGRQTAFVFLKDGKTFFRSSVAGENGEAGLESKRYKSTHDLSLKYYNDEQLRRMITLRPEEKFVLGLRGGIIQYYQPESANLDEGLETFKFGNVRLDYSHISSSARFKPQNRDSERLHIWNTRDHYEGSLFFDKNNNQLGKVVIQIPKIS